MLELKDVQAEKLVIKNCIRQVTVAAPESFLDRIDPPSYNAYLTTRGGRVWVSGLDGSGPQQIQSDTNNVGGFIGYDPTDDLIYIAGGANNRIASMPGAGGTVTLVLNSSTVNNTTDGAIDIDNRILYTIKASESSGVPGIVYSYVIDTAALTQIHASAANNMIQNRLEWDPTRNDIYALFKATLGASAVDRVRADGLGPIALDTGTHYRGMTLDPWNGLLYLLIGTGGFSSPANLVQVSLLDFSQTILVANAVPVVNQGTDLTIDFLNGHLIWCQDGPSGPSGFVRRCKLDGSEVEDLETGIRVTNIMLTTREYV